MGRSGFGSRGSPGVGEIRQHDPLSEPEDLREPDGSHGNQGLHSRRLGRCRRRLGGSGIREERTRRVEVRAFGSAVQGEPSGAALCFPFLPELHECDRGGPGRDRPRDGADHLSEDGLQRLCAARPGPGNAGCAEARVRGCAASGGGSRGIRQCGREIHHRNLDQGDGSHRGRAAGA